jgi:beta-galactosidase/beta-glucuronidase
VRSHWCSLNGLWDFAKTPIERSFPDAFPESILVPFPVESSLSGIGRAVTARDRLWYRRRFQVDRAPPGYTWLLHFGAVDWRADVSLDGRHLGTHEGGFDPFCLELGQLGGEHELVVAVWDPTDDGPQPRGKQARHPPLWARPFFYTPASGIWQTVWLELVPTTRIDRLHLTAKGDALWIAARLSGASGGEYLCAVVRAEGEEIARGAGAATGFAIPIPNPRRWSLEIHSSMASTSNCGGRTEPWMQRGAISGCAQLQCSATKTAYSGSC